MSEQTELGTAVAEREPSDLPADVRTGVDVNALMMTALKSGDPASVTAAMSELVEMEERIARREAERIFGEKFAAFRRELPDIPRNKEGAERSGRVIMYADLETIQPIVDPLLAKHGFFYRFTTEPSKDGSWLIVTCTLQHEAGHAESSTMPVPMTSIPHASGAQNATGTRTYGKRLALSDVLGISTTDDADGAGDPDPIDEDERDELQDMIDETGADVRKFCSYFGIESLADLPGGRLAEARKLLRAKAKKS